MLRTKVCDMLLSTFWWLPFKLFNQNARTGGRRVVKHYVGFPKIDNCASHSLCILIGQVQQEAIRKMLKRRQKSCRKLII